MVVPVRDHDTNGGVMSWSGQVRISGPYGGRHGMKMRIADDVIAPKVSIWEMTGDKGNPDARVRVEIRAGRPECVEVWIGAKRDGRGIQSSDLSVFKVEEMIATILAETATKMTPNPSAPGQLMGVWPNSPNDAWQVEGAVVRARAGTRGHVSRAELEQVADVYRDFAEEAPVQAVAARLGYSSERTAARRVQQARKAGLLPPTTPGKVTS